MDDYGDGGSGPLMFIILVFKHHSGENDVRFQFKMRLLLATAKGTESVLMSK